MTAPDVNADVRARFEEGMLNRGWAAKEFETNPDGSYFFRDVALRFKGYRAAHADLAGEVRELVEAAKVPDDGIKRAAAYIQHKADDYAAENCGMEPDTGATTYHYGRAGEEYHHTLLELVDELTALAREAS